jgi:hypothetical protein
MPSSASVIDIVHCSSCGLVKPEVLGRSSSLQSPLLKRKSLHRNIGTSNSNGSRQIFLVASRSGGVLSVIWA